MSYELNARSSPAPSCGPGGTSTRVARFARAGRAGVPMSYPARNRIARSSPARGLARRRRRRWAVGPRVDAAADRPAPPEGRPRVREPQGDGPAVG
jgi:hypothetical protein